MSDSSLATEILSEADRIIVTVRGQLDVASYSTLALTLAKAIAAGRDEVVVDPEDLDHIDAQDVSLLIRARGLLRFRGQHLVVRSPCTNANVLAACALLDPHAWVERIDRYEAENVS
jgi:anti-anti-sigma factor